MTRTFIPLKYSETRIISDTMNNNISGYWIKKMEKLMEIYPILTDKDLRYREGKENEMMELVGFKMGLTNHELLTLIVSL
jgi:hypothetical protein